MSACSGMPTKSKMEASFTTAWRTILVPSKPDDTNCKCQGFEQQHVEPGSTSEDEEDLIETALEKVIADKVKQQIYNTMAVILELH